MPGICANFKFNSENQCTCFCFQFNASKPHCTVTEWHMLFWRPLTNDSSHRRFSEIFAFRWRHVPCCFVADSLQHAATSTAATNNGTATFTRARACQTGGAHCAAF
jgi:hypothetical protein